MGQHGVEECASLKGPWSLGGGGHGPWTPPLREDSCSLQGKLDPIDEEGGRTEMGGAGLALVSSTGAGVSAD